MRQIEHTQLTVAPHVPNQVDRTELCVSGPGSYHQDTSAYDLSIVSIFSPAGESRPINRASPPGKRLDSLAPAVSNVEDFLDRKAAAKTRNYGGSRPAFHPMSLSSGYILSTQTTKLFAFWKDSMPPLVFKSLQMSVAVSLLW